jgi:hypothetical protein
MISFFRHLDLWNEAIYLKIVDLIINPINFLLIFRDNTFHRFFFAFINFDSHCLKITWAINFIIDLTKELVVVYHGAKALFVDGVSTIQSFHHFASTCPTFEALLLWEDLVPDYPQFSGLLGSIVLF